MAPKTQDSNYLSPETIDARRRRDAAMQKVDPGFNNTQWAWNLQNDDIFDPNSKIEYTAQQDVAALEPLPQARFFDPSMGTQEAMLTEQQIREFRNDPQRFKDMAEEELQTEQSLLDRGKTMMSRLFDLEDEKDLELFGLDLSIVETVWDGAWGILKGVENAKNIGIGGLISAMPGGLDTLSYDELSGDTSFGDVLLGKMKDDTAPTPMQIAIASVAVEAKRIREGGGRATDLLLLNPATAPFILAGIMEEDSPLQEDGFDFLDDEQRTEAFSEGYEKFFSGLGDASLLFADPFIAATVSAKVVKAGALGLRGSKRTRDYMAVASQQTSRTIMGKSQEVVDNQERFRNAWDNTDHATPDSMMGPNGQARPWDQLSPEEQYAMMVKGVGDEIGIQPAKIEAIPEGIQEGSTEWLIYSIAQVGEDGKKVMDLETVRNLTGFQNVQGQALAEIVHHLKDPMQIQLAIAHTMGLPGAAPALRELSAATFDQTQRLAREEIGRIALTETDKLAAAYGTIDTMRVRIAQVTQARVKQKGTRDANSIREQLTAPGVTEADRAKLQAELNEVGRLDDEIDRLNKMDNEFRVAREELTGDMPYQANPSKADREFIDRVVDDMLTQDEYLARSLSQELAAARDTLEIPLAAMRGQQGLEGVSKLTGAYNRRILAKDVRKATAKGQFQREGTSIRSKKRIVRYDKAADGTDVPVLAKDGWFSRSVFSPQGEGRVRSGLRRNLRVWRYLGQSTPSGWIGLKGTSRVGMQKELEAMLDIDLYTQETVMAGENLAAGVGRRDELINKFLTSFYDPRSMDDPLTALKTLETSVMEDLARAYGMDAATALRMAKFGQDTRAGFMDQIKQTGYFADETGDINYAPWIAENAANGAQSLPFQAIEKGLRRVSKTPGGMAKLEGAGSFVNTGFQWFNDVWRPVTLMRASYTQRNVFEGLLRAMAYQNSLVPLTWPARAVLHGMKNVRKGSRATKEAKKVLELTKAQRGTVRRYEDVQQRIARSERRLRRGDLEESKALEETQNLDSLKQQRSKMTQGYEQAVDDINVLVAGTKYGKWREKQIQSIAAESAAYASMNADLLEAMGKDFDRAALESGKTSIGEVAQTVGLGPEELRQLDEMQAVQDQLLTINESRIEILETDLGAGLQEYMAQASRQRHIGSGMSLGPDGNYYHDAWTGPLAQLNRTLMSADNTIKQALVLQMNSSQNILFRNIQSKRVAFKFDNKSATSLDTASAGLAEVIDLYSSNRLIQKMFEFGMFNTEEVVDFTRLKKWLTETDEGRNWWKTSRKIFGEDNTEDIKKLQGMGLGKADNLEEAIENPAKRIKDPSVDTREMGLGYDDEFLFNEQAIDEFFAEVMDRVEVSMWNDPALMNILENMVMGRRSGDLDVGSLGAPTKKGATSRSIGTTVEGRQLPAATSIRGVLEEMNIDDGIDRFVVADEVIAVTNKSGMDSWRSFTAKLFKYLGTIPEDSIVRGPFYAQRFKEARNRLIRGEMDKQAVELRITQTGNANLSMADVGKVEHGSFKMTPRQLREIEAKAHTQALSDTREYMYTIERRTKLGKYGEYALPFVSAMQNSVTVMGKLIKRDPALPFIVARIWQFPDEAGWTDDDGNIVMPIVAPGLQEYLNEHPGIPVIGGILDDKANILIPKDGLNVVMPESGYGIVPRATPLTTVAASQMMKWGVMDPETPETMKAIFGEKQGAEAYQIFKDYIFGEGRGASNKTLSVDKIFPAYMQKFVYAFDPDSALYGYQFNLHQATEMARYRANERDEMPTVKEINRRTFNSLMWQGLGNLGIPTPQTPYPVLTRPTIEPAEAALGEIYRMYSAKAYQTKENTALRDFSQNFGLWAADIGQMKGTKNTGGANITAETVSDIERHETLINELSGRIGPNDLEVLGILVNNRNSQVSYDPNANAILSTQKIPGLGREWRERLGPTERLQEAQRSTGWMQYRQLMDGLDAELNARGLRNYQQSGAEDLATAKKTFIFNARNNPDMDGWVLDYEDAGGGKTNSALTVMTAATTNPDYRNWMMSNGLEGTLSAMEQYIYYRNGIINILNQVEGSINNQANVGIKEAWESIRYELKSRDVRFAEIADLYLSADEDPRFPGLSTEVMLMEQGEMADG